MHNFYFTLEHSDVTCIVACIEARTAREAWEIAGYDQAAFPMLVWKDRVLYVDAEFNVDPGLIMDFKGGFI